MCAIDIGTGSALVSSTSKNLFIMPFSRYGMVRKGSNYFLKTIALYLSYRKLMKGIVDFFEALYP